MAKDRQRNEDAAPPLWQESEMEMLIPVPEEVRSALGPPGEFFDGETIRLVARWKVTPTRPLTDEETLHREMELALQSLIDAEQQLAGRGETTNSFARYLERGLRYALSAWHRSTFGKPCVSYHDAHAAFLHHAPAELRAVVSNAFYGIHRLDPPFESFPEDPVTRLDPDDEKKAQIAADTRSAVEALLAACTGSEARRG